MLLSSGTWHHTIWCKCFNDEGYLLSPTGGQMNKTSVLLMEVTRPSVKVTSTTLNKIQCCKPFILACPPAEVSGFPVYRHQDYRKFYCTFKHALLHIQYFQFHFSVPSSCIFQHSITSAVDSTVKWSTIHSSVWIITIM
jgi:hypothetical protein